MHAFPGMPISSAFMYKYKYQVNNYSKEEEEKQDDFLNISLSKQDRLLGYTGKPKLITNGWKVYCFNREFERQGVTKEKTMFRKFSCWSSKSDSHTICGTYPKFVYIPNAMTDDEIKKCSMFRTKNRFPALSYFYKHNGTSIWR